ncbi:MAG: putative modification methylase [Prokaryotic dsDNA virus sp.]|nr:MAG: putative modification methylase [Prokaryotic dsDNA virus sp.]|tara:strand:- start:3098 stop:4537 length:1440 start_codon:yes stop_codon:yes gene_type:complete
MTIKDVYKECYSYVDLLEKKKIKQMGIVYTPPNIVDYINNKVLDLWQKGNNHPPKVIDFSCGTGVFLMDMSEKIASRWNLSIEKSQQYVFGSDIDEEALKIAKSKLPKSKIDFANGLDVDLSGYDIIVGNPPFVRIQNLNHCDREKIDLLDWSAGSYDLYAAFMERSYKSNAITGLIVPNSWMNGDANIQMRKWFKENRNLEEIINFKSKKVFQNYSAYCCILISSVEKKDAFRMSTGLEEKKEIISYKDIAENHFGYSKREIEYLNQVKKRNTNFLDICDIKTGLATLADDVFLLENCKIQEEHVVTKKNGKEIKIEKEITRICKRASKIKSFLKNPHERVIFPYLEGKLLSEDKLKSDFPMSYLYLLENKERLMSRDSGKIKENCWYGFGRSQGLGNNKKKILLPNIIKEPTAFPDENSYYIGYSVFAKEERISLQQIEKILLSDDFMKWVSIKGSPKGRNWFSIKKSIFKDYRINL